MNKTKPVSAVGVLIMAAASLFNALGSYAFRLSALRPEHFVFFCVVGVCLYAAGTMLSVLAFRFGKLSVIAPVQCCTYVFAILISYFFLNEPLGALRLAGVGLIAAGIVLLGAGKSQ